MKKSSRKPIIDIPFFFFALGLLLNAGAGFCASDDDPNKLLAFKKLHLEKIRDNVEGVFQQPFERAYREVFQRNPRFELVADPAAADATIRTSVEKKTSKTTFEISLIL